ncbi:hypothetical protein C0J52_02181 [Blattella germanica]|nr:hypothetical protein C0J52_02181 [Blattella germanica]
MESKLRYGLCYWGRSASFSKVFIAQKRIIRCMAGLRHMESCKEHLKWEFCPCQLARVFIRLTNFLCDL